MKFFEWITENGKRVRFAYFFPDEFCIDKKSVKMDADIRMIAVIRNTILVVTEHDYLKKMDYERQPPFEGENLFAFDTDGNILWRSKDLISTSEAAFEAVRLFGELDKFGKENIFWGDLKPDHDYCLCVNANDRRFLVDLTEKKFLWSRLERW